MTQNKGGIKTTEYLNIIGTAFFTAVTLIQSVMAVIWIANNLFTGENGKTAVFHYKELGIFIAMAATVFWLLRTIALNVLEGKVKFIHYALVTAYIMSIPTVLAVVFNSTLFALCITLFSLLLFFSLRYFYGKHERRLFHLIGVFAVLAVLSYFNRGAFWCGVFETFVFLTIQLIRNIGIRRKNMADKSWRNTLLLFCILVIIMLLPQYCSYNNIKHTLYSQSLEEQLAARVIVPYVEYEKIEVKDEYLLGVIRNADYGLGHPYRNFKRIIYRYEEDNLNMDEIWKNLYKNAYYRYKKTIAKRYARDVIKGILAPFVTESDMHSSTLVTHHGYYYSLFEKNAPEFSNVYMKFGLRALFATALIIALQVVIAIVKDIVTGKFKLKLEEGRHKIIEAVVLILCFGLSWTLVQTLFSLEGSSFLTSIGAVETWILTASLIWFKNYKKAD